MAFSPLKSIPINGIMLYMSGNGVQIFSVMIVVMLIFNSSKSIMNALKDFDRLKSPEMDASSLYPPTLVYILIQIGMFGMGVWKMNSMGLLPTATSDWLSFMEPKEMEQIALGIL